MLKLENTEVLGWEHAIRGMRNPMNSWEKSDSGYCNGSGKRCDTCPYNPGDYEPCYFVQKYKDKLYVVGPNDLDLMKRLRNAGTDHRKFMRMITVYVDITAPLYWWKEFDTYKVGTVANSCSTMHKIAAKEFTLKDFSCEHLEDLIGCNYDDSLLIDVSSYHDDSNLYSPVGILTIICRALNRYRERYLETKDKKYWWQMIQLLPSSYNQRRTVQMNYEVLANIYKSRRNHKLDEWHTFCDWIEGLPYSELITGLTESEKVYRLGEKLQEGFAAGVQEAFADALEIDKSVLFGEKAETPKEEWPSTVEEASKIFEELSQAINKIWNPDIEDSVDISHLVDITCSWDVEELGGERIYAIGPGFTREDLTPYELYLLEKSEEYEKRKKEK